MHTDLEQLEHVVVRLDRLEILGKPLEVAA
jgi:hypothetical protein